MDRKLNSSKKDISFFLFLQHEDYHSYFEDDSIISSQAGERKAILTLNVSGLK